MLATDGQVDEAIEQCRLAEAILIRTVGSDHAETAMARNNLAHALLVAGRWKEALQPGYQSMKVMLAMGPERRNDVSLIAGNMGATMGSITCYDQSLEYLRYALKVSREANGEQHFLTARAYTTLGKLHTQMADFEAAEATHQKGYEIFRAVSGPGHLETTDAMQRYGAALLDNLQIEAGRQLIEGARDINYRERGPNDLTSIDSDFILANLSIAVGDNKSAAKQLRSVIDRATQRLGPHHPTPLYYRYSLVKTLYADRKFEDALAEAEAILKLRTEHFGEANHDTIEAWNGFGVCNAALGNLNAARHAYETAMQL